MYIEWTKNLKDPDEKASFERQLANSKPVLSRLSEMIEDRLKISDDAESSLTAYNSPSWPYLQAHRNGSRALAKAILKLIDLDHQRGINNE